ncbi:alkyl/aryl-sulfatase [Sandarakinorhabdus cyanobacteriorum]|uniref:Alkyl/aryl-sulfatase n=1 Tax=Sandarakinorhabdus cyanobacteriorum TaxID=1981098 RepID=A0A255YQ36_9SPHN|nr:alkyl sulfatase dimerization domain-containing protein [Sandarakinorhabdus cyanobacteriorum]OYQ31319.1 alkyl/aryl-sulfatase [Sandarakinorhabdus cyanobacteriorum]
MTPHLIALLLASAASAAPPPPTASPQTQADNAALAATLNWADTQDFDFAGRGFLGSIADGKIRDAKGAVLRDLNDEAQFSGPAPATVNPSLWRNASLLARHGLFEVADGIWQVRGFDLANMTIIRGTTGWIIIDPLTGAEAATAAISLVNEKLGKRPVVAVIYTHSHVDHFGGVLGVVNPADVAAGKVAIIAPEGFLEHAVSENVIAGPAMLRRASYMFGALLPRGATGHVSSGLGPMGTPGTYGLIPPTDSIKTTGETRTIDGVEIVFQVTPNTEAPAEMNFYLPAWNALCLAENANGAMHNLLTPRGALVRDAKGWADYLIEARRRWGGSANVLFTSHFWPRWGKDQISDYLLRHAQAYAFVHNESVRLMNQGLNAVEIGEAIKLPEPLGKAWFNRPNYGSLKFNARAVYQRYLGAFDGDPANLDPLPRADLSARLVAQMGGAKKVLAAGKAAAAKGDDRWAATLLSTLVRAAPDTPGAKAALAGVYRQLAFRAEASPWRDFYLTGAQELEQGIKPSTQAAAAGIAANLSVTNLLDSMAVRLVPERAITPMTIAFEIPDARERHLVTIGNGVMLHEKGVDDAAQATLVVPRRALIGLIGGAVKAPELMAAGQLQIKGDLAVLQRFMTLFQPPRPDFPLVAP